MTVVPRRRLLLLLGLVAAFVLGFVRRYINDPVLDTTLSFAAPYVAFLPAQELDASGALAVVVTGLILGHKAPVLQSAIALSKSSSKASTCRRVSVTVPAPPAAAGVPRFSPSLRK